MEDELICDKMILWDNTLSNRKSRCNLSQRSNNNHDTLESENITDFTDMEMNDINQKGIDGDEYMLGLSFEMEFGIDDVNDHYVLSSIHFVVDLLQRWISSNVIKGVLANDNTVMTTGFNDVQAWACPLKII